MTQDWQDGRDAVFGDPRPLDGLQLDVSGGYRRLLGHLTATLLLVTLAITAAWLLAGSAT